MAAKTLTIYLAKDEVENFSDFLSDEARGRLAHPTTRIVDSETFGEGARLYVFVGHSFAPKWVVELRRHFTFDDHIQTSSAAAVLIFRAGGKTFACTFAHGWMYLDDHRFEGDFGLRVAINALDDTKLRRLERANLGDALRGVALSPFQRELTSFGLEDALDLIRKISGRTRDEATADTMSGSRSLRVTGEFGLGDLPDIASDALIFYTSEHYKETAFRIIDSVMPVADRELAENLDELAALSVATAGEDFELGLPVGFEDQAASFKFNGPRQRGAYPDLLMRHYTAAMGQNLETVTAETLKQHKIEACFEGDGHPSVRWSIKSALVGSIVHETERYAANEGEWYRIEQGFKDAIEAGFQEAILPWDVAPAPLRKVYDVKGNGRYQAEAEYNAEYAAANGFVLLDTILIQIPGVARSGFEPCDILDIAGKRLIHVKKSSRRSSVLSHFFKQGANSARQFSMFEAAWLSLREMVEQVAGEAAAISLDGARADQTRPWSVEFLIADTPRQNGDFNIPFFSKVSLRDELRMLRAMRYQVAIRFIELQPDQLR
ncbi:TIGR04141 family sporadically distributed protein [Sphingomonas sp. ASY06-1R]|uniref:TIGR04141 family sporadically distributed protein n=1 Tax=Sphingomonas sp. ASY06-1R TaxID=3445771 RepID=UPI003FA1D288